MISTAVLLSFIEVESGFRPGAFLNDKNGGSYGLTQIDLNTAQDRGYTGDAAGLYNPITNITYGAAQLEWLASQLRAAGQYSLESLAGAYNEGLTAELRGRQDPEYVAKMAAAYARWKLIFPDGTPNV